MRMPNLLIFDQNESGTSVAAVNKVRCCPGVEIGHFLRRHLDIFTSSLPRFPSLQRQIVQRNQKMPSTAEPETVAGANLAAEKLNASYQSGGK